MDIILSESDSLRPYPIDYSQDRVVCKIIRIKERAITPKITSCLSNLCDFPLTSLCNCCKRTTATADIEEDEEIDIVPVQVSTPVDAMDSKFFYAIRNGQIWFKPIAACPTARWKLFGNTGFCNKVKTPLISISADGDNIIAVDENQTIHYAKTNKIICQVSFDCPQWRTDPFTLKWTDKWFSMDGVSLIVNIFTSPILNPVPNARSIAMSHKGSDTMYYTDMLGKKHPDPYIGVTTVYALNEDGTRVFFADPWLSNKFDNELSGPEDGQFKAETLAVSASTVFLFQRARDRNGIEIHKMYTRFADFDSIGSNPALKATYNINNRLPLIRYVPSEGWLQQPTIPLYERARLTKNIAVIQIGWGQNNRQLRVQGQNRNGRNGYYYKNIYDMNWTFELTDNVIIDEDEFLSHSIPWRGFEIGPEIVKDYRNGRLESNMINIPMEITLEKFSEQGLNERGLHTKLVLQLENNLKLAIPLYSRRGWCSLFGISHRNLWKIVIPVEYYDEQDSRVRIILSHLFNNKTRLSVHVYEETDELRITNVCYNRRKYRFIFQR